MILAGITIAQLTGNGLFEKAKEAKKRSENAQELENSILNEYSNQIEKSEIKEEGKTADELIEMSDLAGREVTYIKYKDIYENQQDKWIIVYIGENKDTAEDIVDDMPVNENHIYLLPKYSVAQIAPAYSKIKIEKNKNIVEAQIDTTGGYLSTVGFKDAVRDANNWNEYAVGDGSSAHGAMSVVQYNMCIQWGGNVVSNGTAYWLDDPTWNDAIARVNADGGRSGNGLSYWTDTLCIRPLVMLGTNCKLSSDNRIIY